MRQTYAKRQILLRRSRFITAALAGLGVSAGCVANQGSPPGAPVSPSPSENESGTSARATEPNTVEDTAPYRQDSDGDGVLDAEDACPYEAGTGEDGMRGCPNLGPCLSIVPAGELQIREMAYFAPNVAKIAAESEPVLDAVADALKANPEITLLVSGHCDSTERAEVAKKRAAGVRDYLVARGVSADRLEVTDHGDTRPIRSNATAEGRQVNRRVDFEPRDPRP